MRVVVLPEEHDPDSFARAHSAEEVREYISKNSQDFITYKAKLLLADAENDPIKRGEVVKSIVESIAQIPDNIQRTLFIQQCAVLMSVDESILVGEVARKRVLSLGDKEAEEFIRREQKKRWQSRRDEEVRPSEDALHVGILSGGSSGESLEREILYYLLLYGNESFLIKEGRNFVEMNVAATIFDTLAVDNFEFENSVYNQIFVCCREAMDRGEMPDAQSLINIPDANVCNAVIDILTSNENYVESRIWEQREVHRSTEREMLAVGVPKVLGLYRSKRLTQMIDEKYAELQSGNLSEEEQMTIMAQITHLNEIKVKLSRKHNRITI